MDLSSIDLFKPIKNNNMERLGYFVAFVITLVINTVISAFVVMNLWAWFAVTIFGASMLSFWQSAGLVVLVSFFMSSTGKDYDSIEEALVYITITSVFKAVLYLATGWVIQGMI